MIKCICGLPGSGKNQYATHLAIKYMKAGYKVYSTYPIRAKIRSFRDFKKKWITTYKITKESFLAGNFEEGSIIIFDEAWQDFFNQDWKNVNKQELKKYNGSRHLGISLFYITQSPHRIIPYLRDVTDSYMWIERTLLWNKITEYYELENVGRLVGEDMGMLSPKLVNRKIYFRKKKIFTAYNDSYLKDSVTLDTSNDENYPQFEVKYRNIIKRIKSKIIRYVEYRKTI